MNYLSGRARVESCGSARRGHGVSPAAAEGERRILDLTKWQMWQYDLKAAGEIAHVIKKYI